MCVHTYGGNASEHIHVHVNVMHVEMSSIHT